VPPDVMTSNRPLPRSAIRRPPGNSPGWADRGADVGTADGSGLADGGAGLRPAPAIPAGPGAFDPKIGADNAADPVPTTDDGPDCERVAANTTRTSAAATMAGTARLARNRALRMGRAC
jgi:hypothetical protein